MSHRLLFTLIFFSAIGVGCFKQDPPPENPFRHPITYPVGKSPTHLIEVDLTSDGVSDLVVANTADNTLSILIGQNNAKFPETKTLKVGKSPRWIVSGDFNEDKKPDLGVLNNDEDSLYILINQGAAVMVKENHIKTKRSPYAAVVDDFNQDQHLDIAVVSRFGHLGILLGDGRGQFKEGMQGDPGAVPTGIISGHFNDDRFIDLAIANSGVQSSGLVLFFGKGDGTFTKGDRYRTGMNPVNLIAADFNHDNRPDLLALNGLGDSMTLFVSDKNGKYEKDRDFGAEGGPVSAIAHDFNHDGTLDLIVANSRSNSLSFLVGRKKGGFQYPPLNFLTGGAPFYIAAKDFNEDGKIDLAVANNNDASVSILTGK